MHIDITWPKCSSCCDSEVEFTFILSFTLVLMFVNNLQYLVLFV